MMGALSSDQPEELTLEARLAFATKTLVSRVRTETPHAFLERFVREPSPPAVRFVQDFVRAYGFVPPRDLVAFTSLSGVRPILGDLELLHPLDSPLRTTPAEAPSNDATWTASVPDSRDPREPHGDDAFASLVAAGGSSALLGLLVGALPIARTDAGETFFVSLYDGLDEPRPDAPRRVSRDAVFSYSWVKRALTGPLTRDLSSFAYAAALLDVRRSGEIDDAEFAESAEAVRPYLSRRSPFAEIEKVARKGKGAPYVPPRSAVLQGFARSLWIFGLVSDDGIFNLDDVRRAFSSRHNPPLSKTMWDRYLRAMPGSVPTALYTLFRTYFLDEEQRMLEAISVCRKSPAKLVVDAAGFFDDLARGRRDLLGAGKSLSKAKSDFLSLGLGSPPSSRVSSRSRVRAPGSDRDVVSPNPASMRSGYRMRSVGDLEALAWEHLEDAGVHDAIRSTLAERPDVECALTIVDYLDRDGHVHDNLVLLNEKEEALLALSEHAHPVLVPLLVGRALREDLRAIEMLGAIGDARATPHLVSLLDRAPQRYRHLETSVVSALRGLDARVAAPRLASLLADNPLRDWKEGLERGPLVRELVVTLGAIGASAAPAGALLFELLSSKSLEYRPLYPICAEALARLDHTAAAPRLRELTRIAATQRDGVPTELLWALGQLGGSSADEARDTRDLARDVVLADRAAEVVRLATMTKLGAKVEGFDDALERALWEPAFKREETSRRRVWAFRCFEESGGVEFDMDAVRYFVTLDDHAVRRAATAAFRAQGHRVPRVRPYYRFLLPEIERRGLDALHQALHDKNGVFRYNVALRLAAIGHPSSVAPLVRSLRRLFEEPLASTYEYDDAPHHLVWFCKALKRMGDPRGNMALIEGLRSTDPHVRAVIADDPPDDPRALPELVHLLDDPRSFVRTRAERALASHRDDPEVQRMLAARVVHGDMP